jgi:hypothetical protein
MSFDGVLLFGLLLSVNQIVTLGGLSAIDPELTEWWNDHRYRPKFQNIQQQSLIPKYLDLLPISRDENVHRNRPLIDVYIGTFPSDVSPATDVPLNQSAVHVDAPHAERIGAAYRKCRRHAFLQVGYLIAQNFVQTTEMDARLRLHFLGEASAPFSNSARNQQV